MKTDFKKRLSIFWNIRRRTAKHRHTDRYRRSVDITLSEQPDGYTLTITDGKNTITHRYNGEKNPSRTPQSDRQRQELSKLGNTAYRARKIDIALSQDYFIPTSQLATMRREAIEWFDRARRIAYRSDRRKRVTAQPSWHSDVVDYRANIANPVADKFYRQHGVKETAPAFELSQPRDGELMRTRHCIRHHLGAHSSRQKPHPSAHSATRQCFPIFTLRLRSL